MTPDPVSGLPGIEPSDPSDDAQRPVRLVAAGASTTAWFTAGMRAGLPAGPFRSHGAELDFGASLLVEPGDEVAIAVDDRARVLVLATCCAPAAVADWDDLGDDLRHEREVAAIGEAVADLEIRYADGTAAPATTLRRRFETAPPKVWYGFLPYNARCHRADHLDRTVQDGATPGELTPAIWLAAIANPHPGREIREVVVRGRSTALVVAGLTLWRHERPALQAREEIHLAIDGVLEEGTPGLVDGTLLRTYAVDPPDPATWLIEGIPGFGGVWAPSARTIVELAGTADTLVRVGGGVIRIGHLPADGAGEVGGRTVRRLPLPSIRMRFRLTDDGRPAPGRVHLRAADGRQLQPDGHARFVPDLGGLVDQGTDAVRRAWRYVYVDGAFEVDAPPGAVHVEASRGPDFEVVRRIVPAAPDAVVELAPRRIADPRADGWLASDTHVHFLDPMAAHRQARAEGLELVHLMSAQWGDVVTGIGDLARGPVVSSDDAVVWVGTENRHHVLGHFLAVGTPSVRPLSSGGPNTSKIADATRMTVADWADATRADGGLAIFPHFPYPDLESVADLLCGRLDAVELLFDPCLDARRLREWYRYLDLGLRVPIVTGTDKMGPSGILGEIRSYVHTGSAAIDYEAWASAVRAGRTVVSVGTYLDFRVDGLLPGATLPDAGRLPCSWHVASAYPLDALEIVANGSVVHRVTLGGPGTHDGAAELDLPERGWIAARCAGPVVEELPVDGGIFAGLQVGAHSSPHYRSRPAPADPAELEHLRLRLQGALEWGRHLARWGSEDARAGFERLVTDALAVLERMEAAPR